MYELFVVGFFSDDPDGLTEIDNVIEATGLSREEISKVYEVVKIRIPDAETE